MKLTELVSLFEQAGKRYHLIGDASAGVLAGLDLEGRLYAVLNGDIMNRVNADAIVGQSTKAEYLNPGGDGLWPAPEGSCMGYNYASDEWRVPPGLTGARYNVIASSNDSATIRAEVDLINAKGLGIATAFERAISIESDPASVNVTVAESIEYLGNGKLSKEECVLTAWSLCQFDSGEGCEVVFPDGGKDCVWDMYEPSDDRRQIKDGQWHTETDATGQRYQIGLDKSVPWIEFRNPATGLVVRRSIDAIGDGLEHIDITDREPSEEPTEQGVCLSVYSDPSGFMEIEAAGGCSWPIARGSKFSVTVHTRYSMQ